MIKKLSFMCTCAVLLGFMAGSAIAQISYCKDILEPGNPPDEGTCDILATPCTSDLDCADGALECLKPTLKTWDETWDMPAGETVEMDIWLNDVPESMLTAGFYISYDTALIDITSIVPWDTNNGGLWEPAEPFSPGPGIWIVSLLNFSCVAPDGDGDILLARVTLQCQDVGDADVTIETIPDFDTVVGCSGGAAYDPEIVPNVVTITQTAAAVCTDAGDCDDGNLCTTNECINNECVYIPVVCDDPDLCTISSCNPDTGNCDDVPVDCDDADECTTDSCDPATGCSNEPIVCEDGDRCTTDGCIPETGCEFVPVDCSDLDNLCSVGICNPDSGFCVSDPIVDCSDGELCTQDICNPADGTCSNPPEDCDDGLECTNDSCDPITGCLNEPDDTVCNDDIACTDDTCDPNAGCQNEDNCEDGFFCNLEADTPACEQEPTGECSIRLSPPFPNVAPLGTIQFNVEVDGTGACVNPSYTWEISDAGCTGDATGSAIGSTVDANGLYTAGDETGTEVVRVTDENNGDACAASPVVVRRPVPPPPPPPSGCTTNDDCDDGVFCNGAESCVGGTCGSGTPPCDPELCNEETDTCIDCLEDADCDDGVDCTDDSCVDETCVNMPNDESCPDDGLYCNGEEFCDEAEGCSSTGNPCGAGETCDEETDSCAGVGACVIDVLTDSLIKSNFTLRLAVFGIETAGIDNLSILTPVTVECESDGMGRFGSNAIRQLIAIPQPSFGTNTRVIWYIGITLPVSLTGIQGRQSETCTVTVGDCQSTDSFELNYRPFPLSE